MNDVPSVPINRSQQQGFPESPFHDEDHALFMGELVGTLQSQRDWLIDAHFQLEMVDGNWTNRIHVTRGDRKYVLVLEKEG